MSFLELLSKGGLVMIPLFICSLIAIAILLERRYDFISSVIPMWQL